MQARVPVYLRNFLADYYMYMCSASKVQSTECRHDTAYVRAIRCLKSCTVRPLSTFSTSNCFTMLRRSVAVFWTASFSYASSPRARRKSIVSFFRESRSSSPEHSHCRPHSSDSQPFCRKTEFNK